MVSVFKSVGCVVLLCLSTVAVAAPKVLSSRDPALPAAPAPDAPAVEAPAQPAEAPIAEAPDQPAAPVPGGVAYGIEPAMITKILESKFSPAEKAVALNCAINHYRFWWSAQQIEIDPKAEREMLFCNRINEAYKRETIFADCEKFQDLFDWEVLGDAAEFFQASTSCDRGRYVDEKASVAPWSCTAFAEEAGELARLIKAQAIGGKEVCAISHALNTRKIASCGDLGGAELATYRKQASLTKELEAAYCGP